MVWVCERKFPGGGRDGTREEGIPRWNGGLALDEGEAARGYKRRLNSGVPGDQRCEFPPEVAGRATERVTADNQGYIHYSLNGSTCVRTTREAFRPVHDQTGAEWHRDPA